ncbi:hypothetical protein EDB92DRAFT_1483933 [Lactarius akahatsu]|uniref:Uncharacterized protein n=1 Tax=Lactarius akahatsu TaxID=416441 RepID=A0AAD4Q7I2_9AGAM|nr:hypothetical protein EDB92DRAFT_1483933 [Lactarius akahatsu]
MAFGQERTLKTPKVRIYGSSHRIREDASVCLYSTHTSLLSDSQIASEDPKALLVFSRSSTSPECDVRVRIVPALRTRHRPSPAHGQVHANDDRRLSARLVPNVFSVARFRELVGAYPARITIVGHDFKWRRFEQPH